MGTYLLSLPFSIDYWIFGILLIFLYCYFSNTYKNVNVMGTSMSGLRFFLWNTIISKRK